MSTAANPHEYSIQLWDNELRVYGQTSRFVIITYDTRGDKEPEAQRMVERILCGDDRYKVNSILSTNMGTVVRIYLTWEYRHD